MEAEVALDGTTSAECPTALTYGTPATLLRCEPAERQHLAVSSAARKRWSSIHAQPLGKIHTRFARYVLE